MRPGLTTKLALIVATPALLLLGGCVMMVWRTEAQPQLLPATTTTQRVVKSPIKVHMLDGSTVVFSQGGTVRQDSIIGAGQRFALLADRGTYAWSVPSDSVAAIEVFEGKLLTAPTVLLTTAATAAGVFAFAGLMVAIFGSCPTLYADSAGVQTLQAEGFSYAIAPMFEHRDLDRLRVRPDADGVVRLELRNEALETHFINQVELAAVTHARNELVVSDHASRPLVVRDPGPVLHARDRAGRDVRGVLSAADDVLFASDSTLVARATARDLDDWIDLEIPATGAGDSIAVVLRLRNSLLNTVLLYDGMLGGPDALDWLGIGLQRISTAIDLSRWYVKTMGMHVSVLDASGDPVSVRLNDVGPIAFRDVGVVLPAPRVDRATGRARVRLRFVADNWRIDQVQVATAIHRPETTWLPVSRVIVPSPAGRATPVDEPRAPAMLSDTDDRYLETRPGQRLRLEFDPRRVPQASDTTYLIAWQGWYREWVRGNWITNPVRTEAFVPGEEAVATALRRWSQLQHEYEKSFYSSKVPVR